MWLGILIIVAMAYLCAIEMTRQDHFNNDQYQYAAASISENNSSKPPTSMEIP